MEQRNKNKKTEIISIKTTPEIKKELQESAKQTGQNLSAFILYNVLGRNYKTNEVVGRTELLEDLEQLKRKLNNKEEALDKIEKIAEKVGRNYANH